MVHVTFRLLSVRLTTDSASHCSRPGQVEQSCRDCAPKWSYQVESQHLPPSRSGRGRLWLTNPLLLLFFASRWISAPVKGSLLVQAGINRYCTLSQRRYQWHRVKTSWADPCLYRQQATSGPLQGRSGLARSSLELGVSGPGHVFDCRLHQLPSKNAPFLFFLFFCCSPSLYCSFSSLTPCEILSSL